MSVLERCPSYGMSVLRRFHCINKKTVNEKNNVIKMFLLCNLLLTEEFLYCQRNLWLGGHIDAGVIDFLSD